MLIEVKGDLLKSDCTFIAHCANCFNTMGSGIARQIKEQFPLAYQADCSTARADPRKLGTCSWAKCNGKMIFNLYGQYRYGTEKQHLEYDALKSALEAMNKQLMCETWRSNSKIGFPHGMGCCRAGGNWNKVEEILADVFSGTNIWIYSLES